MTLILGSLLILACLTFTSCHAARGALRDLTDHTTRDER